MNKTLIKGAAVVAALLAIGATQLTFMTIEYGSTHVLLRNGIARDLSLFESDTQYCLSAPGGDTEKAECFISTEKNMTRGKHHLFKLPYIDLVETLSGPR